MSPTPGFIYFDLDDTLLDHRGAERKGLAEVCRAHTAHFGHLSEDEVHRVYHEHSVVLWRDYALGHISKEDLQRLRFERMLAALRVEGLEPHALNTRYLDCYARHWTLSPPAREAFHTLADHFRVGILTNGFVEVQRAKFERFPELGERSEAIVVSEEVGYMKPHPEIFAHAARTVGVPAAEILYVGDSYASDVEGALGAGWQAAWYTDAAEAEHPGVFCFRRWDDLVAHLLGQPS